MNNRNEKLSPSLNRKCSPPNPDLSNLTSEELDQLKKVLIKQQQFENEVEQSLGGLKKTFNYLASQKSIKRQEEKNSSLNVRSLSNNLSTDVCYNDNTSGRNMTSPFGSLKVFKKSDSKTCTDTSQSEEFIQAKSLSATPMAEAVSFLNNFKTLRTAIDRNKFNESTGSNLIGSVLSRLSLRSNSSSNSSLNCQTNVCSICKTNVSQVKSPLENVGMSWKMISLHNDQKLKMSKQDILSKCADCSCLTCERCGNLDMLEPKSDKSKWRCKLCLIKREVAKKTGKWTTENIDDDNDFASLHRNKSIKKIMNTLPIEKSNSDQQAETLPEKDNQQPTKSIKNEDKFFTPIETNKTENTSFMLHTAIQSGDENLTKLEEEYLQKSRRVKTKLKALLLVAKVSTKFSSDDQAHKADENEFQAAAEKPNRNELTLDLKPTIMRPQETNETQRSSMEYKKENQPDEIYFTSASSNQMETKMLNHHLRSLRGNYYSSSDGNTENEGYISNVDDTKNRRFSLNTTDSEERVNQIRFRIKKNLRLKSSNPDKDLTFQFHEFLKEFKNHLLTKSNENTNTFDERILVKQTNAKRARKSSGRSLEKKADSTKNCMTITTNKLNEFIKHNSVDENKSDEIANLTNLARVILIEHQRSLEKNMTNFTDESSGSSIHNSTESRRDSFSSRQDSSISANELDVPRKSKLKDHLITGKKGNGDRQRQELRNSEEWNKRRKELIKTSKKWSNAFDENLDAQTIEDTSPSSAATPNEDMLYLSTSLNRITNDSSLFKHDKSPVEHSESKSPNNEENYNTVSIHYPEAHNIQLAIKQTSDIDTETTNSSNSDTNLVKTSFARKTVRRLPDLPKDMKNENSGLTEAKAKHRVDDDQPNQMLTFETCGKEILVKRENKSDSDSIKTNDSIKRQSKFKLDDLKSPQSNNLSKSIDSIKTKRKENRMNFTNSFDLEKCLNKNLLLFNRDLKSAQRSLDYPYIVRKNPKLSDIVRKRLLFQKVKKNATLLGESFSSSVERDHIPKVPRKIIIRQDNSIEICLTRPPRIRRQTISEDIATYTPVESQAVVESTSLNTTLKIANHSTLSVSSTGSNDRRKTIETCENIFLQSEESTKLRARTPPSNPHRILLCKDKTDKSLRTNGLGMRIYGGFECEDGTLGCFVTTVVKGGPADINNILIGDQILEFNGHSLIDATYESVRLCLNNSGDYVQLVVHHNNIRSVTSSPLEISRHFETVPRFCQSMSRKRRNLPPLPSPNQNSVPSKAVDDYVIAETIQVPSSSLLKPILVTRGRLLMQIWNNVNSSKLAITIIQASNMPPRSESEQWFVFASGRLTPDDSTVKNFKTSTMPITNPIWNETFVFEYHDSVDDGHLEVCIHDTLSPNDTRLLRENFIGMIILPLNEANLDDEPRWYELRDKPTRKNSTASVTFKSSSNDSQESLTDRRKGSKKNKYRRHSLTDDRSNENNSSSTSSVNKLSSVRKLSRAFARLLSFRRSSESALKKTEIRRDSEDDVFHEPLKSKLKTPGRIGRRHTDLLSVNFLIPPNFSTETDSRQSSHNSSFASDEDIDKYFFSEQNNHLNDLTPGIGQVPPKSDCKNDVIVGYIKLGFIMSKGQFEIMIYEAKQLNKIDGNTNKDTYVKTYLRTATQRLHKKKTQVVRNTSDPVFNTKLHYNACNVLGRRIQVMIWEKAPKLDKNQCIGEVFIQPDSLDLSHQSISWYKLYQQHVVESDYYDST